MHRPAALPQPTLLPRQNRLLLRHTAAPHDETALLRQQIRRLPHEIFGVGWVISSGESQIPVVQLEDGYALSSSGPALAK